MVSDCSPMNQPKVLLKGNTTLVGMVQHNSLMGDVDVDVDMYVLVVGWGKGKTSFHGLSIVIPDSVHQTFHYWEHSKSCIILILEDGW